MNERRFWINRIKNTIEKVKDGTFDAEIIRKGGVDNGI